MNWQPDEILSILDKCCDSFTFPMLDNGYVYLAATRLSLYRSEQNWALVIEIFGFSPRVGIPDTSIYTFASQLYNRNPHNYVTHEAYEKYLANNPHNEFRSIFPIEEGEWMNPGDPEYLSDEASNVIARAKNFAIPSIDDYKRHGILLVETPRVRVFEFCRFLAAEVRDDVLANSSERRVSVLPEMHQILQLEEWNHPNVVDDEVRPSKSETFQQLARILVANDVTLYHPTTEPNTHWMNWPEGGSL